MENRVNLFGRRKKKRYSQFVGINKDKKVMQRIQFKRTSALLGNTPNFPEYIIHHPTLEAHFRGLADLVE